MSNSIVKNDLEKNRELNASKSREKFTHKVIHQNAVACSQSKPADFDTMKAISESADNLTALKAEGSLQEMLAAQMTSIHFLQQMTMGLANLARFDECKLYYTNAAVKLANCFTQQAALLAKLQGAGGQKIIVEHVEVHHGGQAVVGNIHGGMMPVNKEKK